VSTVTPADSTYAAIEQKVRYLTASPSQSQLSSSDIQKRVNVFYIQDFPCAIKLDVLRSVYTFYTAPYIDRYPVNVNYMQGFREPCYVDGIRAFFYKDRSQFFNLFPKWPTLSYPITGDGSTQSFSFTSPNVPFLRNAVTLGGTDTTGAPIQCADDGNGNIQYLYPNPQISVPVQTTNPAVPGMYNLNTANPGLLNPTNIGTVNYVTGAFSVDFSTVNVTPASGQRMNLFVSWYTTARPYAMMFWNNEIYIRPVPRLVHRCTVETYLTPVQFMLTTNHPILDQFWQYLAYGTAIEILRDRQDMEGVQNLMEGFQRQEALVLERQATEEIGQRNSTIFSSTQQTQGWNQPWGWTY
jgi:hypothetical protein